MRRARLVMLMEGVTHLVCPSNDIARKGKRELSALLFLLPFLNSSAPFQYLITPSATTSYVPSVLTSTCQVVMPVAF